MRISLLLEREPFGPILEQTLARYWSHRYGTPYQVRWQMGRGSGQHQPTSQVWLGNIYLNAIFRPTIEPAAFDPIQREFARSTVWWKRPLQRGYVASAKARLTAPYFAQAYLHVTPHLLDSASTLIVAGNHKVRLLNHCQRSVNNLLKVGFGDHFMRRELAVRHIATACGVPVPALLTVDEANGWYTERYISGTPTNRLANQAEAAAAVQRVAQALQALYDTTAEQCLLTDYLDQMATTLHKLLDQHQLLSAANKRALQEACTALVAQLSASTASSESWIETVLTHGDFQPANILLNAEDAWLIDWEYTARRQRSYDLLVFELRARAPQGLATRLQQFVQGSWPKDSLFTPEQQQRVPLAGRQERRLHATLFLLEDLLLHLEENNQPPLTKVGVGLIQLQHEIETWLATSE